MVGSIEVVWPRGVVDTPQVSKPHVRRQDLSFERGGAAGWKYGEVPVKEQGMDAQKKRFLVAIVKEIDGKSVVREGAQAGDATGSGSGGGRMLRGRNVTMPLHGAVKDFGCVGGQSGGRKGWISIWCVDRRLYIV